MYNSENIKIGELFQKAMIAYRAGDLISAMDTCKAIISLNPDHADAYIVIAKCLQGTSAYNDAILCFKRLVILYPGSEIAVLYLAGALSDAGDWKTAGKLFQIAVALAPANVSAYTGYGLNAIRESDPHAAVFCHRAAHILDLGNEAILQNYASCLEGTNQGIKAIAPLKKLAVLNPGRGQAYYLLARVYLASGNWQEAENAVGRAARFPELPSLDKASKKMKRTEMKKQKVYFPRVRPLIFDNFIFFNELELLEIRLHELDDVVDYFVLVEATRTFSNKPKKLFYEENKERFQKFSNKIIHVVVEDFPEFSDAWQYEFHQRNQFNNVLNYCDARDILLMSDVDEIPRASAVKDAARDGEFRVFEQDNHYYYLNCRSKELFWHGSRIVQAGRFTVDAQTMRDAVPPNVIKNGGWHFSYLGGAQNIIYKIESFSHQEYNVDEYKNPDVITKRMQNGEDMYGRGFRFVVTDIEKNPGYPEYIRKNIDRFSALIAPRE